MSATRWGLLGLLLLPASLALAQEQSSSAIPRTQDGRPDFHGVWATDLLPLTFQRVRGATKLVVGDVEAQALSANLFGAFTGGTVTDPGDLLAMGRSLPSVNGEWRTSMIISPDDGKSPLTAEGQRLNAQEAARAMAIPDGHEQRPWGERCLGSTGRLLFLAGLGIAEPSVYRCVVGITAGVFVPALNFYCAWACRCHHGPPRCRRRYRESCGPANYPRPRKSGSS
jgi:hypothetical protein